MSGFGAGRCPFRLGSKSASVLVLIYPGRLGAPGRTSPAHRPKMEQEKAETREGGLQAMSQLLRPLV